MAENPNDPKVKAKYRQQRLSATGDQKTQIYDKLAREGVTGQDPRINSVAQKQALVMSQGRTARRPQDNLDKSLKASRASRPSLGDEMIPGMHTQGPLNVDPRGMIQAYGTALLPELIGKLRMPGGAAEMSPAKALRSAPKAIGSARGVPVGRAAKTIEEAGPVPSRAKLPSGSPKSDFAAASRTMSRRALRGAEERKALPPPKKLTPRQRGTNPRAVMKSIPKKGVQKGTNPRAEGTNPRALRARKKAEDDAR